VDRFGDGWRAGQLLALLSVEECFHQPDVLPRDNAHRYARNTGLVETRLIPTGQSFHHLYRRCTVLHRQRNNALKQPAFQIRPGSNEDGIAHSTYIQVDHRTCIAGGHMFEVGAAAEKPWFLQVKEHNVQRGRQRPIMEGADEVE